MGHPPEHRSSRRTAHLVAQAPGRCSRIARSALIAVALASAFAALPYDADAQRRQVRVGDAKIPMRFPSTDLARLLRTLGPRLDTQFLFESTLSGRVTIAVTRPVDVDEAWELLHAALAMRGYAAVPMPGTGYKIVKLPSVAEPWSLAAPDPRGESRIITLVELRETDPAQMLALLRPLLDATTLAVPHSPSNSLILGSSQRHLHALIKLLRELDRPSSADLVVRRLFYVDATRVRDEILGIFLDDALQARPGAPRAGARNRNTPQAASADVWADERSNSVLYRAPTSKRDLIAALIDGLDVPPSGGGEVVVIPVRFADPTTLAEQLGQIAADTGNPDGGPAAAAGGRRTSQISRGPLNVIADPHSGSLIVNGRPEAVAAAEAVVAALDVPPKQVAIDVFVEELSYEDALDLGVRARVLQFRSREDLRTAAELPSGPFNPGDDDYPGTLAAVALDPSGGAGFGPVLSPADAGGLIGNLTTGRAFITVISTLTARDVQRRSVMQPHLVVLNGEEHTLHVGNEVPVPTQSQESGGALQIRTNIERRDTGVELTLRPVIGRDDDVLLDLDLSISAVSPSATGDSTEVGVDFVTRDLQARVQLRPGEILLVGGAETPESRRSNAGTPFFRKLPVVGWLFRQTRDSHLKRRLLFALQARALPDSDAHTALTVRRRLAFERSRQNVELEGASPHSPYALYISTETSDAAARALAARLDSEEHPARVLAWDELGEARYDVHVLGFASVSEAADEATRLAREGYVADLAVAADPLDAVR